jgi:hypothetical protein
MQQQQNLQKYIDEIDESNKKTTYNNRMLMQMSGEEEDSRLRMTSNYYQYSSMDIINGFNFESYYKEFFRERRWKY